MRFFLLIIDYISLRKRGKGVFKCCFWQWYLIYFRLWVCSSTPASSVNTVSRRPCLVHWTLTYWPCWLQFICTKKIESLLWHKFLPCYECILICLNTRFLMKFIDTVMSEEATAAYCYKAVDLLVPFVWFWYLYTARDWIHNLQFALRLSFSGNSSLRRIFFTAHVNNNFSAIDY